jgi:hypothetical protein
VPFFCGVVHDHSASRLARAGWSWPLTRVDLREHEMHAYTPVLMGRWTLDVPFVEVDEAIVRRYRWGGKIRLRRSDGDVTVTTMGGNYVRIAELLREKGVRVTADQGPAGTSV